MPSIHCYDEANVVSIVQTVNLSPWNLLAGKAASLSQNLPELLRSLGEDGGGIGRQNWRGLGNFPSRI